ncbi:hypothetical protein ABPG74_002501 [Tetrahymena malaccensis]
MNNQNSQNQLFYYNLQANSNVRQQPGQFNLPSNSGNILPFAQISKEKDYTYAAQPPVLNQQHIQLQPQQLMMNQKKIPNQNIPNTLQSLQTNFPTNQIVNKQHQLIDLNYAQQNRSSLAQVQQVQQANTVNPQNPFASTSINNQATQMTLTPAQTPTIPQNLETNQQYLQNNLLNGNNNKQTVNQNHIVQNSNSNNLQTQDVLQPEITLPLHTTQNQIKGTSSKKQQQMAFYTPDQTKQNNQLQKNSQYQQISLQQQQGLSQFIQIPSPLNQQQNQQQNLAQQQVSVHQNIHNSQSIIKPQTQTQPQQNINEFDGTHYIVPKVKSSIINNQNNVNENSLTNNYIDFNQQTKSKDSQKIVQLNNLYPQQQLQNQQLLQQERIEDKKVQLSKENIQQIQQQNQIQLTNMLQNEGEGENAYGDTAQVERFINIQKNSKFLILSEKIRIKYENKDVNNSLCSDFDINNWTNEIDNINNLYEMTLTGHLIKAIEFMNGETSLNFLIDITKPFLKNKLRKKSGKQFGDGDEDRIIKGGLAEHCFQKKDQNQDIWMLNQEKLQSVINDTNDKLKKYIDNLKKSKGKGQTSVISQGNEINQSFQQDHQNLNDNFQGTKPTKNADKKQRRKNQEKLKDKTAEKQNAIYNNLGKEHHENYGDHHLEDQNDLMMNEEYNGANDRNSEIMLGDEEEKKENHGHQSFLNAQNYQKPNKISSIKLEETNLLNNQGFYLPSNPSNISQNQYPKNIDIKIESQQDRKASQQIVKKQNSFSISENNSKKRIFHENDDNFDEGNQNNGASSKTALYRQHQGTQNNNNQFNDQNELNQGFNSNQLVNLNGNQNCFQNKGFVLSTKAEQQNDDNQQKIELSQRQIKCKKLTEQQIKEYKKKNKVDQFAINEQLNQELGKKENQDITKSINQIDHLKIVGMALCYEIFKDQITKMVNVIKENQDTEVRKMNQRSKEMKNMLQQLQLL